MCVKRTIASVSVPFSLSFTRWICIYIKKNISFNDLFVKQQKNEIYTENGPPLLLFSFVWWCLEVAGKTWSKNLKWRASFRCGYGKWDDDFWNAIIGTQINVVNFCCVFYYFCLTFTSFSCYTEHAKYHTISFIVWIHTEKTGISVCFSALRGKILEEKNECVRVWKNRLWKVPFEFMQTHTHTFLLIFCMRISYFRFVFVGYQALLFIVAVIFQSVFSLSDMLFAKHTHTHSFKWASCWVGAMVTQHMVKNTRINTSTHRRLCAVCCCWYWCGVYVLLRKGITILMYFSFQFVVLLCFSFLFCSVPFISIRFGVSHPFFCSIWFVSFLFIVLYTEGIFNNNGK